MGLVVFEEDDPPHGGRHGLRPRRVSFPTSYASGVVPLCSVVRHHLPLAS